MYRFLRLGVLAALIVNLSISSFTPRCPAGKGWNGSGCLFCGAGTYSDAVTVDTCTSCPVVSSSSQSRSEPSDSAAVPLLIRYRTPTRPIKLHTVPIAPLVPILAPRPVNIPARSARLDTPIRLLVNLARNVNPVHLPKIKVPRLVISVDRVHMPLMPAQTRARCAKRETTIRLWVRRVV